MQALGNRTEDSIIDFKWSSNDTDGAAITRATNGTVAVYKANDTTQSTAGVTDTEDFDGVTGVHHCRIDTSADAFYEVGKDYQVVLSAATIDGFTVNTVLASFTLEYGFAEVDVVKWLGTAVATPTVAGVPEVDLTHIAGDSQSATDLKDFADAGYDPATNKVQGVVLVDTLTTYTGNTPQTGDSFTRLGAPSGASHAADVAAVKSDTAAILGQTGTTGVVVAAGSKGGYALSAAGLDAVLIEQGISAGAGLTNDTGTQLTSINARQALALAISTLCYVLAGAATTNVTTKPAGKPAGNNRIDATVTAEGNRTAVNLKVPD